MSEAHCKQTTSSVTCAVITVSDTRTIETDTSGALIRDLLTTAGHRVASSEILPDEPGQVRLRVGILCEAGGVEAIILTGGTGLASRDTTYEAVGGLLDKRLDGFGELFRMLSFQEIGPAAMLSRAVAGTRGRTAVFSLPGSTPAVRLAMERLILPQLGHIADLMR
jgi:molybdenum cofactor biosynthesis protein B